MVKLFNNTYSGKTVLVTGHSGFKGSWLCTWLKMLGAKVCGFALKPQTNPNHYEALGLDLDCIWGDIRHLRSLTDAVAEFKPDVVFHMAAQPLVLDSYANPVETFETNVLGTVNILEACRQVQGVKCIVNITSDKCYQNKEWFWGYRENDTLGGQDPYSCSKSCAELITDSYRKAFFAVHTDNQPTNPLVSSVRAGNVIGGGDWAKDRIFVDIVRAVFEGKHATIRNPEAIRPWQHVLDPLSGYLIVGQKLLERKAELAESWNFGPRQESILSVDQLLSLVQKSWNLKDVTKNSKNQNPHESKILALDSTKAMMQLGWKPVWNIETAVEKSVAWYSAFYQKKEILTTKQIEEYVQQAATASLPWL